MTKNTTFMEEFAVNIREYMTELEQRIGRFSKRLSVHVFYFNLMCLFSNACIVYLPADLCTYDLRHGSVSYKIPKKRLDRIGQCF